MTVDKETAVESICPFGGEDVDFSTRPQLSAHSSTNSLVFYHNFESKLSFVSVYSIEILGKRAYHIWLKRIDANSYSMKKWKVLIKNSQSYRRFALSVLSFLSFLSLYYLVSWMSLSYSSCKWCWYSPLAKVESQIGQTGESPSWKLKRRGPEKKNENR